jgi:membrane-associated phospholipid phosphatase
MKILLWLFLVLLLAAPVRAQSIAFDTWTPPLPTHGERVAADAVSWATSLSAVALDAKASWDAPDRLRAFELQGVRVGITYGAVFLAKTLVHRERPCAPACGADNPDYSFYSGHTAIAFASMGGARLAISLPLAVSTAGLRVAAGKHWLTDVLVGAGAGALTSRIR